MDRRTFIAASAAAAAAGSVTRAPADDNPKPTQLPKGFSLERASGPPAFTTGELAHNSVAKGFGLIPDLQQPLAIGYDTADGPKEFTDLTGKVRILALWADWCPPCLREMPELAALQTRHGDSGFEFLAVLTACKNHMDFATARKTLDDAGGAVLPLWVEPDGNGQTLALAIADYPPPMHKGANIPCAVIVDAKGMVRAHMVGIQGAPKPPRPDGAPIPPPVPIAERMWPSIWTTADADAFIKALKNGALG